MPKQNGPPNSPVTASRQTPSKQVDNPSPPTLSPPSKPHRLNDQLKDLRLPTFRDNFQTLAELTTRECQARNHSRIQRLLRNSHLLSSKTWGQFQWSRVPLQVARQVQTLRDGTFLDRRENVLIFGKPGSGKTHLLSALGEQLVHQGRSVLFTSCNCLVQEFLTAKRELKLAKFIKRIATFEALIIDDLGYVQQSREEMEVLFTLLAERHERGSVLLTSNLPF